MVDLISGADGPAQPVAPSSEGIRAKAPPSSDQAEEFAANLHEDSTASEWIEADEATGQRIKQTLRKVEQRSAASRPAEPQAEAQGATSASASSADSASNVAEPAAYPPQRMGAESAGSPHGEPLAQPAPDYAGDAVQRSGADAEGSPATSVPTGPMASAPSEPAPTAQPSLGAESPPSGEGAAASPMASASSEPAPMARSPSQPGSAAQPSPGTEEASSEAGAAAAPTARSPSEPVPASRRSPGAAASPGSGPKAAAARAAQGAEKRPASARKDSASARKQASRPSSGRRKPGQPKPADGKRRAPVEAARRGGRPSGKRPSATGSAGRSGAPDASQDAPAGDHRLGRKGKPLPGGSKDAAADAPDAEWVAGELGALNQPNQDIRNDATVEAASAAAEPPRELPELVRSMVDRISVSVPRPGEAQEVHVTLQDAFLDGSTVKLVRENGQLAVTFVPQTKDAELFLANQSGQISNGLQERLGDERVVVQVEHMGAERQSDSAAGDGRSRQRYEPQPDADEQGLSSEAQG